jgi:hypothetical protein
LGLAFYAVTCTMRRSCSAPVAQLDRVSGYEPEGRAFESLRAHQQGQATRSIFGLAFLLFGAGNFFFSLSAKRAVFCIILPSCSAPVAQLDRVSGYEPEGRAFESLRAHQASMKLGTSSEVPFFILAIAFASLALLPFMGELFIWHRPMGLENLARRFAKPITARVSG